MNPQLLKLLNKLTAPKTVFNPAIRVKNNGTEKPTWIDDISRVNGTFIITVSTLHDNCKRAVDKMTESQQTALALRLATIIK